MSFSPPPCEQCFCQSQELTGTGATSVFIRMSQFFTAEAIKLLIVKFSSKETTKKYYLSKICYKLNFCNEKVIFIVFCAKEINKLVSYYQ